MKLFELIVDDIEDEIFAISLVETPAIESNFVFFDKEEVMFAKVEDEKRMVMGPVLIPDKKILRVDAQGQPYEVFFTKDTVADLARAYLKNKYTDSATLEHEKDIDGVHLVESWIKTSKSDKSNDYGLNVPIGTWMGQFYIENDEIWEEYVKEGKVKGFSIEGLFTHLDRSYEKRLAASVSDFTMEWDDLIDKEVSVFTEEEATSFLSKIKALIKKDGRVKEGKRIERELGLLNEQTNLSFIDDLDVDEAKDLLTIIHSLLMPEVELEQPSVDSTYPGEVISGSIKPETL